MRHDTRPAPGTVASDLGHGVTVVERDAPAPRDIRGVMTAMSWVAPYSLNCGEHGWIESRRTVAECEQDGREHIAAEHSAPIDRECEGCGAEPGEPCRWGCLSDAGQARA